MNLKKILNDNELKQTEIVKNYLKFSFNRRRPKKDYKVYINLANMYEHQPELVKEILLNINKLGYYKDYIWILSFSKNEKLNNFILNLILDQIEQDLENNRNRKTISTLAKWLPRENSKLDKKIGFVDKFINEFYPDMEKFKAKRRYRKMKTMLNNKLGTLEAKLCTKQYDKIDFKKVSHLALKRNMNTLNKNEECKIRFDKFTFEKYCQYSLSNFICECSKEIVDKELMKKVWENNINKYMLEIPYLNKHIENSIGIFDLSMDTFNLNMCYFVIGVLLLVDNFSKMKDRIVICNFNKIKFNIDNISDRVKYVLKYCAPCKSIDLKKYYDLLYSDNEMKNFIIVSNKEITDFEKVNENKLTTLQIKLTKNNFDINFYNGTNKREIKKIIQDETSEDLKPRLITQIIEKSFQQKYQNNLYKFLLIIFMILILANFYFLVKN